MQLQIKTLILQHVPYWAINALRTIRGNTRQLHAFLFKYGVFQTEESYLESLKRGFATEDTKNKKTVDLVARTPQQKIKWAKAFQELKNSEDNLPEIKLLWADGPAPGNFGDWLSPYLVKKLTSRRIELINDYGSTKQKHLVVIGSLAPAINNSSFVLGAGAATRDMLMNPRAQYFSVRGPYTAKILQNSGGPIVKDYGDLGFIMSRIYKPKQLELTANLVLVRHMNHAHVPLTLPKNVLEISIALASTEDIETFVDILFSVGKVVTSAMHCFIVCQSYGIPCALVNFIELSNAVYGDGIKYTDAMAGAGLVEKQLPRISLFDEFKNVDDLIFDELIESAQIDRIEMHARASLEKYLES